MAIKVTGTATLGGATYYKDPELTLVPHLVYRGMLHVDVNVLADVNGVKMQIGARPYQNIDTASLNYPTQSVDPYTDLITALESYIIADLTQSNPDCSFTTF